MIKYQPQLVQQSCHQQYESELKVHRLVDVSSHDAFLKAAEFGASLGEDTVVDPCQEYSKGGRGCSFNYESGPVNAESWMDEWWLSKRQ